MAVTISYREEQYPAVSGQRCITVYIPDDDAFLPVLAGLLAIPTRIEAYAGNDADQAEGLAALWLDAYQLADWSPCLTSQWLVSNVRVWYDQMYATVGNDPAWGGTTTRYYGGVFFQNPAAINDELKYKVALKAGQYTVTVLALTNTNRGIQTIKLDGDTVMTNDLYSASQVENVVFGATYTVPADGVYDLTSKVAAKNASSSSYVCSFIYINFRRTGD